MPGQKSPLGKMEKLGEQIAQELGIEFYDVELVKEAAGRFLRFYIEKDGGISLSELEAFHRKILPLVGDVDYDYMEVSSPGADRPLKKQRDFERAIGLPVEIRTYRPIDGAKQFVGDLIGWQDGVISIQDSEGLRTFEKKDVALAKMYVKIDEEELEDDLPME